MEVSGKPQIAIITSPVVSMYRDKYQLEWRVESFLRIEECRILFRIAKVVILLTFYLLKSSPNT